MKEKYRFGADYEKEFDFCGIHFKQREDGSIEMDQNKYVEKIFPIQVSRERRKKPNSPVDEAERQQLRQLCGSLQYASVHTRPDISAKVGVTASKINTACVEDLLQANRVLVEAKANRISLITVPIPESRVTFCGFSDASFSTSKGSPSRPGALILSTDQRLVQDQQAVICPIAWSSKKIPRVVTSTLSSEAIALSSALDRLSYIRVVWEWLKNPSIDWTDVTKILKAAPKACITTDCKSVFDVATKLSPPQCSEYRTTLECPLIRQRLQENISLRWICSQAMLADSLTKCMC